MIAFNFNIHFQDEPSLDDGIYDTNKKNINIVRATDTQSFTDLAVKSDYQAMSGREASYGAQNVYSKCKVGCKWGIDVQNVVSLLWCCGKHTIEYIPQKEFTPEILQFWVLHTILPMLFTLDETYTILHVGAVEVNGSPILFSAASFGGKSTLTDYFLKQGHTLLSDDTLGIYKEDDSYVAVASYPFHRPFRDPESLGHKVTNVMKDPKPIKTVYLLEKSDSHAEVYIEEVKGIDKFRAFHFSTFINFDFLKEQRFKILSSMAHTLPVYRVKVPWHIERLPEVYNEIVMHNT